MDGRSFKQRVQAREPVLGTFLQLGCPLATEIVGQAGFDWGPVPPLEAQPRSA
jgi:2-keto-3-deoxy-L-rhamnonate aldolase RhmA